MPEDDVSDLRDVFDAINKLCDTMKTSTYGELTECPEESDSDIVSSQYVDCSNDTNEVFTSPEDCPVNEFRSNAVSQCFSDESEIDVQCGEYRDIELVSPEDVSVQRVEVYNAERWSDATSQISLPGQTDDVETVTSDTEPVLAQCEPISEMYYTASSEISLLSDLDVPDKVQEDERETKDDRKECVIAGHVAAMRERFESMTRTNTPCPDLVRSLSPSLEVFRNTSPSPDRLA